MSLVIVKLKVDFLHEKCCYCYLACKNRQSSSNNISAYVNVCKLSVRERESMCFPYIKRHFVAKNMDMICRFYPFVHYIYLFGQCRCGFWFFCCKDLWNNSNNLAKWYGHVMRCLELRSPCISLKIIAHLRTFDSQSDSSIQQPHSIIHK